MKPDQSNAGRRISLVRLVALVAMVMMILGVIYIYDCC